MSLFRVIALVVALAFLLGGRNVSVLAAFHGGVSRPASAQPAGALMDSAPDVTTIPDWLVPGPDRTGSMNPDASGTSIDVFGNEVDEAVGDYRVDPRGDLYERHSPDTEVPRLRPAVG